jgi:hypothetical protein
MFRIAGTPVVWAVIAFAVFLVYKAPTTASALVGDAFHLAGALAVGAERFLNALAGKPS